MDYINKVSSTVDTGVSTVLQNPYIMAFVKLTITLYAIQLAPKLPDQAYKLFENTYVKMFGLFLIVYIGNRDLQLAIMLAVVYVLGVNMAAGRHFLESFTQAEFTGNNTPRGKLLEPQTMIYPGCEKFTIQQLVDAFGGDQEKLLKNVEQSFYDLMQKMPADTDARKKLEKMGRAVGLPYNMSLERGDDIAPYLATILMYRGFTLSDSCKTM